MNKKTNFKKFKFDFSCLTKILNHLMNAIDIPYKAFKIFPKKILDILKSFQVFSNVYGENCLESVLILDNFHQTKEIKNLL